MNHHLHRLPHRWITLAVVLTSLLAGSHRLSAQALGVFRELWTGVAQQGNSLLYLTNTTYNPNWPDNPNSAYTTSLATFETLPGLGNYYGQRLRTYLVPATNGTYTFWIASDDYSILYLNTNSVNSDDPAGMNQICWANVTGQDVYTAQSNQKSVAIPLLGGHRYYMEARMEQGTGGEYLSAAWANNPNNAPTVIGGSYVQLDQVINIAVQPTNTTVVELSSATFNVRVSNFGQPGCQWRQGTTPIPGATNATLVIPYVFFTNSGTTYACLLTNTLSTNLSASATLTVLHDTNPPVLGLAADVSPTNIWVNFSKIVNPATATNATNYAVSGGLTVVGASMFGPQSVVLLVSPLTLGSNYTVTVNNVTDPAYFLNVIAPNSQTNFVARGFAPWDIGSPVPSGSSTVQPNGLDVTGGGSGIGDVSDQFQFDFQARTGDFDLQVQVQGLNMADVWAKAGLMARESVNPGSRFAATFATPSMAGCFFESRTSLSNASSMAGSFQVNLPNTWLRLQRLGAVFNGYASFDGSNWVQLGSVALTDGLVYVGYAVTSHNTNQSATAQFRGFADVTGGTIGLFTRPGEPLQACSRRTTLVISEIMYKPAPRSDSNNLEYLEVYNSNPYYEDLSGYQIGGGDISFTFPPNTILAGGAFLVVAASPSSIQTVYGIPNVTGPYVGTLPKAGLIQLSDPTGVILLEVPYSNLPPWPVGAQGTGHSIVLARPSYGEGNAPAWALSPLRNVVINEFLANPGATSLDYIELYNHSAASVDVSGCVLTDNALVNKFIIPSNTILPAGGFVYYPETQLGFGLNAAGQSLFFKNPDNSRILDATTYDAQSLGVSFGRWPDGAADWYPLVAPTPGAPNTNILVRDIVINELMYKPISGNDDDQYVELYNKGTNTVNLGGWMFADGITFTFPSNTFLAPDGYLVIARNVTNLIAHYANLNTLNTIGAFATKLPHGGGRIALTMPEAHVTTSGGVLVTNTLQVVEDEVTYSAGGRWGTWAHGGGSSLELINPNTNQRLAFNWGDSDETRKSSWTNLEYTGVLDLGANYTGGADMVQVGLLDVGECLVDNIEVRPGTNGPNYVANSTFESGLTNWTMQGDHMRSGPETALGGYSSSQCLRLRSSDGAWTLADYAQGTLTNGTLAAGTNATLRLKARWLRGWPEILMRLRGNWLEVTGALPLPANLGTPGQRNSRALASVGPAIYEIQHAPAIPSATQPVVVTARFHDFKGFQPTLLWRVDVGNDPAPSYTAVPMVDDGTGGDALAQDGLFSATIPAQASGTVVAFLVQARNPSGASTIFPIDLKDNAGVPRECVVGFGDPIPTGSFMHHHMFITQNWANRWGGGGGVSHELHDLTWVDGGGRVVYNVLGRYAGSPYHQYLGSPIGTVGGMHWIMPDDDQVMGTTTFNKQHVPGNGPLDDDTLQREQASFWMARRIGLVWENRRYYVCYVNGNRHGPLMEDAQVPGADLVKQYFPNDNNGWLYKNHSWFEGDHLQAGDGSMPYNNYSWCLLGKFTTTINGVPNQYKLARYRWMWWIRQFPDSANNFSNVFALIDAANTPTATAAYYTNMETLVDTEEWMRLSAMEHATGDWDSFFTQNAWNMYCYKPTQGKWTALKWDWNITLGGGTSTWGPDGAQLFNAGPNDPVMATFQSYPPYRRAYLRAFKEIAAKAMNNTYVDPMLDSKYAAFAANGLANTAWAGMTVKDPGMPNGLKSWIATMRISLLTALTNQGVNNVSFQVTGGTNYNTGNNVFSLSGTAPVEIKTIRLNGVEQPVLWTSPTVWTMSLVLHAATNVLALQGYDVYGVPVALPSPTVTVTITNRIPAAQGTVVINEIMYNPVLAGAQYVELYNNSPTFTFDLSNWRFDKLNYTFAPGAILAPRTFLVLAKDRNAFTNAYGTSVP
ncbi:MAG: lamin tail domain-containing protein, partial [Verrucomicrobia bacterium]|nr:lamin tail domain-containing protein [Verrucomicrobiota bacterium]